VHNYRIHGSEVAPDHFSVEVRLPKSVYLVGASCLWGGKIECSSRLQPVSNDVIQGLRGWERIRIEHGKAGKKGGDILTPKGGAARLGLGSSLERLHQF